VVLLAVAECSPKSETSDPECRVATAEDAEGRDAAVRHVTSSCVVRGDTFSLWDICEIGAEGDPTDRFRRIDTADLHAYDETGFGDECYAREAAHFLESLLTGWSTRVEFDESCTDHYSRTLTHAFIEAAQCESEGLLTGDDTWRRVVRRPERSAINPQNRDEFCKDILGAD
jgi:endonuclease YncB( thermonuclease family)